MGPIRKEGSPPLPPPLSCVPADGSRFVQSISATSWREGCADIDNCVASRVVRLLGISTENEMLLLHFGN